MPPLTNRKPRPAQSSTAQKTTKSPRPVPALRQLIAAQFAARSVSLPKLNHRA